ncbi:MAG: CocE/NonD family hydrolase [Chloroflexota bacterium]|nr:CocE/NonD family hydrolase [Chloroflexota bacterium]
MQPRPFAGVKVEYDVPATLRDGVVLRANVYRPDDGGDATWPVLLTRLPYGKDLPMGSALLDPAQAARRGYIVVVQDVRGTFSSEGAWYPFKHEREDGEDSVAWAAQLPGSNGQVGMFGASYFGQTQWMAAKSPALRAMVPTVTWADAEETSIRDGVLEWGVQASWLLQQSLGQMFRRYAGDPQTLGKAVYSVVNSYDTLPQGYTALPLNQFPPLHALDLQAPLVDIINARDSGDFGDLPHGPQDYDNISLPTLHIGGWYDIFLKGTIRNFDEMRQRGRPGQRLVIGPWTHGVFSPTIGDIYFGMASSGALLDYQIDLMSLQLQFFDRWLKDIPSPTDDQPAVKYFLMGANIWRSSETWPPAAATEQRWYLHSGGHANSASGDGALSQTQPGAEPADHYTYDPLAPTPTIGGPTLMHGAFRAGPIDQGPIEQRDDTLVFTSAPLERPLEVTGPVSVTLHVATDAPDTDFVARLVDVYPDGRAIPLTDGITRLMYRDGVRSPSATLEPGRSYPVTIDLWATGNLFLPGHRVRLDVASSSFPRWERNLNTGQSSATTTEAQSAHQTILHDSDHPSYLALPVMPGE